ncbi:MAG: NYN domain-containing protein [Acidobacteriota bacterium]
MQHERPPLRSALFVDFDNIFLGLQRQQAEAADLFATGPDRWLKWLETTCPSAADLGAPGRRILVRRCYMNPRSFGKYRPHFIRSGFEVVDTPPLTAQGKTSADIHMVIDMLDALAHPTRFDEFIVFSGDADFTPVLLRLRQHDRRTLMLPVGPSSPAYRASSDLLLDESDFLESGLGLDGDDGVPAARPPVRVADDDPQRRTLHRIAHKLAEIASLSGRIEAAELPRIYKDFSEFSSSGNWLGFFSLRAMTEAVVGTESSLEIFEGDPWSIGLAQETPQEADDSSPEALPSLAELKDRVLEVVAAADRPVVLAAVAQSIQERFGNAVRASGWLGTGSLKGLIDRLDFETLRISHATPGHLFDPARHAPPESQHQTRPHTRSDLPPIAQKLSQLTEMPALAPETYREVLEEIASEVNENGYHLTRTSKAVRDRCAGLGTAVARAHVSFLLKGIVFSGHHFGLERESPAELGKVLVRNTLDLCTRSQVELTEEEQTEVAEWILGGLPVEDEAPEDGAFEDETPEDAETGPAREDAEGAEAGDAALPPP